MTSLGTREAGQFRAAPPVRGAPQGRRRGADNTASPARRRSRGAISMKAAPSTITPEIDVQALRVGMFAHLHAGWISHPFPLSSFRITTAAQVATIRSLGLARVRWSPQDSDLSLLDGG